MKKENFDSELQKSLQESTLQNQLNALRALLQNPAVSNAQKKTIAKEIAKVQDAMKAEKEESQVSTEQPTNEQPTTGEQAQEEQQQEEQPKQEEKKQEPVCSYLQSRNNTTVKETKKSIGDFKKSTKTFVDSITKSPRGLLVLAIEKAKAADKVTFDTPEQEQQAEKGLAMVKDLFALYGRELDLHFKTSSIVDFVFKMIEKAHPYRDANNHYLLPKYTNKLNVITKNAKGELIATEKTFVYFAFATSLVDIVSDTIRAINLNIPVTRDLVIFNREAKDKDGKIDYSSRQLYKAVEKTKGNFVKCVEPLQGAANVNINDIWEGTQAEGRRKASDSIYLTAAAAIARKQAAEEAMKKAQEHMI